LNVSKANVLSGVVEASGVLPPVPLLSPYKNVFHSDSDTNLPSIYLLPVFEVAVDLFLTASASD
jgi:hypothetical protein